MSAIKNKRQSLGDANIELACGTIQKMTESTDNALNHAYMACILASDEDSNMVLDPLFNRKPIPFQDSVIFHQTQLNASQKSKILRRVLHLISKALQVYQEYDNIKYKDNNNPNIECTASY